MMKFLRLLLSVLLVLSLGNGFLQGVDAEEENPYDDFIMDDLFREEDDEIEYLEPNDVCLAGSNYSLTSNICDAFDYMSSQQANFVNGGWTSYGNVNFLGFNTSGNLVVFLVNGGSVSGSTSAMKFGSGKLYMMSPNGTVTDYTKYMANSSLNVASAGFYTFSYTHISGTKVISDRTYNPDDCKEITYTLSLTTQGAGTVTGGGIYSNKTDITFSATPLPNNHFVSWSDGNTDNPRTVRLSEDLSLTAIFEEDPKYTVAVSVQGNGSVTGTGEYYEGTQIVLSAVPDDGYYFSKWSDGSTSSVRIINVLQDYNLTAYFERSEPSACKFSTTLLDNDKIFTLINSVQQSFSYGNSVWSDWAIYHHFVYTYWSSALKPYSYELKVPVHEYYEIRSLNDPNYSLFADVRKENGYVKVFTPSWGYDETLEDVIITDYFQDTYDLKPAVGLMFTDREGTSYELSYSVVSNQILTKKCFSDAYDDGAMQSAQYGILSQIYSILNNKLAGLDTQQVIMSNKLEQQNQLVETQNNLQTQQNQLQEQQNQLIQDQYNVDVSDDFGLASLSSGVGEKMGVLSFVGESSYILLDLFDPAGVSEAKLTFPAFTLKVQGKDYKIWDNYDFDFAILDEYLGGFMNVVRSVTTLIVWIAVVNYCIKEFEKFWRS